MKKMLTLVLSIVFAFTVTSCATTNNGTERKQDVTTTTTSSAVTTKEVVTKTASATTQAPASPAKATSKSTSATEEVPSKVVSTTTREQTSPKTTTTEKNAEVPTSVTSETFLHTTEKTMTESSTTVESKSTVTESVTTKETTVVTIKQPVDSQKVILDVTNIPQYPELPMGSSIAAATTALNYYGLDVSKMELLHYCNIPSDLDINNLGNPEEIFIGDPAVSTTCYGSSSVIRNAINTYFSSQKITGYEVVDLKGTDFSDLYFEINNQNPVVIWVSSEMGDYSKSFKELTLADGGTFTFNPFNLCVCLVGFDKQNDTVYVCNPESLTNVVEYPRTSVEAIFNQMGRQALVLHRQ